MHWKATTQTSNKEQYTVFAASFERLDLDKTELLNIGILIFRILEIRNLILKSRITYSKF
jgi:hypothetical protein